MCIWQFLIVSLEPSDDALPFAHCQTSPWSQDVQVSCHHPSFVRMQGGTNCFPELQKMLKSYAASPVIDYSLNFTYCVKSAFQNSLLLWSQVGHRLKITEINLSDKNTDWNWDADAEAKMPSFCLNILNGISFSYLYSSWFLFSVFHDWHVRAMWTGEGLSYQREPIPGDSKQPAGVTPLTCKPSTPESTAHSLSLPARAVWDTIRLP